VGVVFLLLTYTQHIQRHSEAREGRLLGYLSPILHAPKNRPSFLSASSLFTCTSVTCCTAHPFLAMGHNTIRHEPLGFSRDRGGRFISADAYDITIWIFQAYSMILHSQPSVIYMHLRTKSYDSGEWGDVQGWGDAG
jgi:hypothetical protein